MTNNGHHLFNTQMRSTPLSKVFTEGSWSILQKEDVITGEKNLSSLLHKCEEFKNPNIHHIYHSTVHQLRCTECKEQVPVSVETLWRLLNMDIINNKTYITIFIQSTKNKNQLKTVNLNKSKLIKVQC